MNGSFKKRALQAAVSMALIGGFGVAQANVNVQCPGDDNGNAEWDGGETQPYNTVCKHFIAGDGFAVMSDGSELYTFGFGNQTGALPNDVIANGILNNEWPGPTIVLDEGDEFYLSLTNVGTTMRPDLFDPHTVHFHGFPNAASVFDGVPEVSISINMGGTLTYYYNIVEPGTYLYHCHVEATEHMEMGMLANLYVRPAQNRLPDGTALGAATHSNPDFDDAVAACIGVEDDPATPVDEHAACVRHNDDPVDGSKYVYNDGDGTTRYDEEKAIQLGGFDSFFHEEHIAVQPLPFSTLESDYPQFNGRGYPDTVKSDPLDPPPSGGGQPTQKLDSAITLQQGQTLLLRISNVGLDRFWTLTAPGLTMKQVGTGARHMRGPDGKNVYLETASINSGGGESMDVLIDTNGVAPGTYFLQTTELHQMSNRNQMDGGMITEIVVE